MFIQSSAAVIEALPVAAYTTDAQGRIVSFNAAAANLLGARPAIGSAPSSASWRLSLPDGNPLPHEVPDGALQAGRAADAVEALCERPDGTRVAVLLHRSLLQDDAGRVIGAINVLTRGAARSTAEIDLARLAAIVESSDDAIISKTLEGRITSWNVGAERIFGYSAGEMIGAPITRIIPCDLHAEEERISASWAAASGFRTMRLCASARTGVASTSR